MEPLQPKKKFELMDAYKILGDKMKADALKREAHLHQVLSKAFQMLNLYLVFQGILIAADFTSTKGKCSIRWMYTVLSVLGSMFNLITFFAIRQEYYEITQKLHQSWSWYDQYQTKIEILQALCKRPEQDLENATPDNYIKNLFIWFSAFIFLLFAIVVIVGFWTVSCS